MHGKSNLTSSYYLSQKLYNNMDKIMVLKLTAGNMLHAEHKQWLEDGKCEDIRRQIAETFPLSAF